MEERYLDFDLNRYVNNGFGLYLLFVVFFFYEYSFTLKYAAVLYTLYLIKASRIRTRTLIKKDELHLLFYRGGGLVYRVDVTDIQSIELDSLCFLVRRVSVWLKNGQVHDVKLGLLNGFRYEELKNALDEYL